MTETSSLLRFTGTAAGRPAAVLHVSQPVDAGVARYVADAATAQHALGWTVTVACPATGWLAGELDRRGIARVVWDATRSPGPAVLGETLRLRRLVDRVHPDVVHLHSAKAGLAGRLALRGRVRTIFQPHGWSWLAATGAVAAASLAWERVAARWTDEIVCVGRGEADLAREAGVGRRHAIVRNGVDLEHFAPATPAQQRTTRAELGVPADVPLVVCPARHARQKGQDVLLAAWNDVRTVCPDAQLALVGDGTQDIEGRLPEGVRLVGVVSDVRPWLVAADVVALPSRWEGLSLGLLEAMAVGRSVVVSAIPGLVEAIDDRVGAAVPAEDAGALAAALAKRLCDPRRTAAEGAAAATKAAVEFDAVATFQRLAGLTAELVSSRTAA